MKNRLSKILLLFSSMVLSGCSFEGFSFSLTSLSSSESMSTNPRDTLNKTKLNYTYDDYSLRSGTDSCPNVGNPKLLIIPIWFNDSSTFISNKENVRNDIETTYFGTNEETGWRSVKTYYEELSKNTASLTGTVSEWHTLDCSYQDYEPSTDTTTALVGTATDWYFNTHTNESRKDYDSNGDGYLDGIILIYAAPNYKYFNNYQSNLWAYSYWTYENVADVNNPTTNIFFWASYDFMYGNNAATRTEKLDWGYGDTTNCNLDAHTFIHEMGHVFGLDDYYDYSGQYIPAGAFSMQDYNVGSHDPYSVMALGWANPYIPTETCEITINAFQDSNDVILLTPSWNTDNSPFDEYLLLELYTPTGLNQFDITYPYGKGLTKGSKIPGIRLWHVDARLLYYPTEESTSSIDYVTNNPYEGLGVYHMMSNTYYKEGINEAYISQLGKDYANYNLLQLIRNQTHETYDSISRLSSSSLFLEGDSFSMNTFSGQFYNSGKLNTNIDLGWSFEVKSIQNEQATIKLIKG